MSETAIVNVAQGALRGKKVNSTATGKSFYSFQGIPFAKPPLGRLRFKAPQPPEPWTGIRDARKHGNVCAQVDLITMSYVGEEDCLFLNVYTTQLPRPSTGDLKKPVMVFIHGGGFASGSGDSDLLGPDYFVAHDVLLVTFNYRLGPLGFLTTEDREIPGNAGLKDQVAALKWVKQNILRFGGDPANVTIFGGSAGGASVHYLVLSPLAKGLFQRAISQSGCALNSWAYSNAGRSRTVRLAQALGCTSEDSQAILALLRDVAVRKLVEQVTSVATPEDVRRNMLLPFVPTYDGFESDEESFLPAPPAEIIKSGKYNRVAYILGVNSCEGIMNLQDMMLNNDKIASLDKDMQGLLPEDLFPVIDTAESAEAARKMKEFYFANQPFTNETRLVYAHLQSDLMFVYKVNEAVRQHAQYATASSPFYLYYFCYDGELCVLKRLFKQEEHAGVCHGDELGYMFNMSLVQQVAPNSTADLMREKVLRMWTKFARNGKPSPEETTWEAVAPSSGNHLVIDELCVMKTDFETDNMRFWDELYHSVRRDILSKFRPAVSVESEVSENYSFI